MRAEMKRGARKIATLGCRDRKGRGREVKHLGASLKSRGRACMSSTGSFITSDEQSTQTRKSHINSQEDLRLAQYDEGRGGALGEAEKAAAMAPG